MICFLNSTGWSPDHSPSCRPRQQPNLYMDPSLDGSPVQSLGQSLDPKMGLHSGPGSGQVKVKLSVNFKVKVKVSESRSGSKSRTGQGQGQGIWVKDQVG